MSACTGVERSEPELEAVDRPQLDSVDPDVRGQLDAERRQFDLQLKASLEPGHLSLVYGVMGRLYHAHDFLVPAAAAYRNAIRLDPRHQHWHYYLGTLYQHLGRFEEAAVELSSALAIKSDAATLRRLGDIARVRRQPVEARRFYERALEGNPTCHAARLGLAETARDQGEPAEAISHYREVLARQPDAYLVHYPLAQTLLRLGDRENAEIHLRASAERPTAGGLASCPDELDDERQLLITGAPIHIARGRQAAAEGLSALELSEYRKAVELAPDLPLALWSLGNALARRGENEEAVELYLRGVAVDPQNPDFYHDLGALSSSLGRRDEAIRHYRAALELRPDHVDTLLQLGLLVMEERRPAEAKQLFDSVLEMDSENTRALLQRAMCFAQLGYRREAADDLGTLLDLEPPAQAASRFKLAAALAALGDQDRALEHFTAVLDLQPDPLTRAQALSAIATISKTPQASEPNDG